MIDNTEPRRYYPKAVRVKTSGWKECEGFLPYDSVEHRLVPRESTQVAFPFESDCWLECARLEEAAKP